jgi:hypothetical protein
MADTVPSPNMNMPVPVVGTTPGEDWATDVNACLSIIDEHTHTSGQGVPITPDAININANLPLNNNNLITARSVRFSPQTGAINGAADLGCLYEQGLIFTISTALEIRCVSRKAARSLGLQVRLRVFLLALLQLLLPEVLLHFKALLTLLQR